MRLSIGERRHHFFGKRQAANRHGQFLEGHPRGAWSDPDAFEDAAGVDAAVKVPRYRDFPGGDQIVDGSRRQQGDAVCRQRGTNLLRQRGRGSAQPHRSAASADPLTACEAGRVRNRFPLSGRCIQLHNPRLHIFA